MMHFVFHSCSSDISDKNIILKTGWLDS